jgi:hypothetical protein
VFAILAIVCFVLSLAGVEVGSLNLVTLGLLFMAAELLFAYRPWNRAS